MRSVHRSPPPAVRAAFSDGYDRDVPITWDPVDPGDYAAAGIQFYLRVDLENGIEALEATLYQLVDGEYREAARSVDGMLRSSLPWPFEADVRTLAKGRRHRWDD